MKMVSSSGARPWRRRTVVGAAPCQNRSMTVDGSLEAATARGRMRETCVLVHGAWHGGWCWREWPKRYEHWPRCVHADAERLDERSHTLSSEIDVETHITAVVNLVEWEDVRDAVLVGHSYAG